MLRGIKLSKIKNILQENRKVKWLPKIRFSMRTLFILVTLLCVLLVPFSVKLYQARQQRLAVEWVLANGGTVEYDYYRADDPNKYYFLRRIVGNDLFNSVTRVYFKNPVDTDLSKLTQLQSLERVSLRDPQNVDLSPLGSLKQPVSVHITFSSKMSFTAKSIAVLSKSDSQLPIRVTLLFIDDLTLIQPLNNIRWLNIYDSQVSDLAPLIHLTQLEKLTILRTPVKDYSPLKENKNLKTLNLDRDQSNITDFSSLSSLTQLQTLYLVVPNVTDLTPLAKLVNLRKLWLQHLQAKDLSPLSKLSNLESLFLTGNQVPIAEVNMLEKALPNCEIKVINF